jgi:hypothetical protein
MPPAVALDDKAAIPEKRHVRLAAAHTTGLFRDEECTFEAFKLFEAFQANPDTVLVIGPDPAMPPVYMVVSEDQPVFYGYDPIAFRMPGMYFIGMRHYTGIGVRYAFGSIDIPLPVGMVADSHRLQPAL